MLTCHFIVAAREIGIGSGLSLLLSYSIPAVIPNFTPLKSRITAVPRQFLGQSVQRFLNSPTQIQNHCTREGISWENAAVIPKSWPEIKNHCSPEAVSWAKLAAIPKFTPSNPESLQKVPHPQHPSPAPIPSKHSQHIPPSACASSRAQARISRWTSCINAGSKVAAKAGADAPGGGISLCFCRRGCAAPTQKAASLNEPMSPRCCRRAFL